MTLIVRPIPKKVVARRVDDRQRHAGEVASGFVSALQDWARALPMDAITLDLAKQNPAQTVLDKLDLDRLDRHLTAELLEPITATLWEGWQREAKAFATSPFRIEPVAKAEAATTQDFEGSFTTVNPGAVRAAQDEVGSLIKDISDDQLQNVRELITRGFVDGIPPRRLATMVGGAAGMTTRQLNAFMNYGKALSDLAERNFPNGVPDRISRAIDDKLAAYQGRLLKERGMLIARTETIRASNLGQQALWDSAIQQGYLAPEIQRMWITAEDEMTCPLCADLDGATVAMDEPFVASDGTVAFTCPLHPNCRCSMGLAPAEPAPESESDATPPPEPDVPTEADPADAFFSAGASFEDRYGAYQDLLDTGLDQQGALEHLARQQAGRGLEVTHDWLRELNNVIRTAAGVGGHELPPSLKSSEIQRLMNRIHEAPVSKALNSDGLRNPAVLRGSADALRSIDAVHTDGALPEIPLRPNKPGASSEGAYEFRRAPSLAASSGDPVDIRLKAGAYVELTTAHEIGHFLDHQVLDAKNEFATSSRTDPLMTAWLDAVKNSSTVQALMNEPLSLRLLSYRQYLMSPKELWARSYAQYIAQKSANPRMLRQIADLRLRADVVRLTQWSADEFAPISAAIDAILADRGWLRTK